jgi:glutamate/tyrosine decarboxylase-like PLP-dependent enzyme
MDEGMHSYTEETEDAARAIVDYALQRIRMDPPPIDRPMTEAELTDRVGDTVTPKGMGSEEALRLFADVLAPACISVDNPRFLAFVPAAPTKAAILFDLVVSASSIFAGTWLEAAGSTFVENQALAWLVSLAGMPDGAGGVFVSGGTAGNLSGLVAARHAAGEERGGRPDRWRVLMSGETHSSVATSARVMDADVLTVPTDERGRMTGAALRAAMEALSDEERGSLFAIVANAGATNSGAVDELAAAADVAAESGLWLHVDAAYGGAALAAPSARGQFDGIERADSVVIDPHKWLFAPYDCAALLYARPGEALHAHIQQASYLDEVNDVETWNPMHYAVHLSRRARGLPFWFSLAANGTDAYADAIEAVLSVTHEAAEEIRRRPDLELVMDPQLSVVLFRRRGWSSEDYSAWCERLLADGVAFLVPTAWRGERMMRFCFVNPRTTIEDVRAILDTMAGA